MSSLFPAILIGGEPHRGKSVLVYRLSSLLRTRQIAHYTLRATPDGEGNWYHDAPFKRAQQLRHKHSWGSPFEEAVEKTLIQRPLPFLVDVGGKPTERQKELFSYCTHSIILGKDQEEWAKWREICQQQQLQPLAEICSLRDGQDMLLAEEPILRLQLANLDRERQRALKLADLSDSWQHLAKQVAETLGWSEIEMWDYHRTRLPFDALPLNLAQWLRGKTSTSRLPTDMLKPLIADIPQREALAVYGWAPTWVTSTLALHSSSFFCCFDAQYGWLTPPTLQESSEGRWEVTRKDNDTLGVTELAFTLNATHLTYHNALRGALPLVQSNTIILSGKLPIWLYVALARHYGQKGKTIAIANPSLQAAVQINGEEVGRKIPWGGIGIGKQRQ